ncbi:serine/threonine-protein kinase [Actinomadura scrupuli]|uniref:serine/threonine-protein kinase n=1 Tax=Actinomadura scrupuli TaxID=559629 RepID=UPI003D973543
MQGIADYDFIESLGQGNHGEFFLARRPERLPVDAEFVAVKVVGGTGQDAFRRATRELQMFAAVRSPHLVTLYDAGQQGGIFYYSMEYLPAGSLASPATPLDRREVYTALAHAAEATQALHEANIVHRDIKPGNVLLTSTSTPVPAGTGSGIGGREIGGKLSDLGLSQVLTPGVTVTGMGGLTSVEFTDTALLRGEAPSPAGDVWSLGATLHWSVSGLGLYGGLPTHDPLLTLRKVLSTPPQLAAGLSDEVADLVRACIGDVAERPSPAQVAAHLEALSAP